MPSVRLELFLLLVVLVPFVVLCLLLLWGSKVVMSWAIYFVANTRSQSGCILYLVKRSCKSCLQCDIYGTRPLLNVVGKISHKDCGLFQECSAVTAVWDVLIPLLPLHCEGVRKCPWHHQGVHRYCLWTESDSSFQHIQCFQLIASRQTPGHSSRHEVPACHK